MRLAIDGREIESGFEPAPTVGLLLEQVRALPELRGRVIASLVVDGREVPNVAEAHAIATCSLSELDIVTKPVLQLLHETLVSSREYLPRLAEGAVLAAARIHQSRLEEAVEVIDQLVNGLQWYLEVLGHVITWRVDEVERSQSHVFVLTDVLRELVSAWEQGDYTLLADVLEYEFAPKIDAQIGYVERLLQVMSRGMENDAAGS